MGTSNETPTENQRKSFEQERPLTRGRMIALGGVGAVVLAVAVIAALSIFGAPSSANTSAAASTALELKVTSPTSGSVIASDQVTVTGTVSPADATVTIQNHPAAVGNGVFTGSADLHSGKTTIDVIASAPNAAPTSTTVLVVRPSAPRHHHPKSPTATTSYPGGTALTSSTDCGDGLTAGPNTTCPFAENVRMAYEQSGPGVVTVYSPVTNATYEMSCSYGPSVVCTGGNHASVYFTNAASPAYNQPSTPSYGERSYGERNCGAGLEAGPHTTCPFAQNVRSAYEADGPGTVEVYSPVTHETYTMSCGAGSPAVCTGGKEASVYIY